jgi:hypothetical protein
MEKEAQRRGEAEVTAQEEQIAPGGIYLAFAACIADCATWEV